MPSNYTTNVTSCVMMYYWRGGGTVSFTVTGTTEYRQVSTSTSVQFYSTYLPILCFESVLNFFSRKLQKCRLVDVCAS